MLLLLNNRYSQINTITNDMHHAHFQKNIAEIVSLQYCVKKRFTIYQRS